ncbi:hypothetical protein KOR34_19560 [Posidoniimonas corsicana]|uniref:PEP-CTERM protein-sorting domain-containing protein n=1 Tax=Posidoniimonas corsicana TaxID=1938618 RepID=A0A5C5VGD4_9BACT|nr:hypothetical protein [Posidoniimonas corsicana]TWT37010.1 hypothetical protein KOR34_19560 [Posidoniimonas corsicana]
MKLSICVAVVLFAGCQALAQSTFVAQVEGTFELREGSASAVGRGPVEITLTTNYSTVLFEFSWDVELLMAGAPEETFETRLSSAGRMYTPGAVDLSFPDALGITYAPQSTLNWENEFSVTERVVSFEQTHESTPQTGTRGTAATSLGVSAYPEFVAFRTQPDSWARYVKSIGKLNTQSGSEIELLLSFNPSNLEVALTELLPGDFNSDSAVDGADYTVWRDAPAFLAPLLTDYGVWRDNYGVRGSGSVAAAPEPTAVILLGWTMLAGCLTQRRF